MSTAGSYQIFNVEGTSLPGNFRFPLKMLKCELVRTKSHLRQSDTAFIYFGDCSNTTSVISYQMSDSEAWPDSSCLLSSSQRHSDEDSSPSAKMNSIRSILVIFSLLVHSSEQCQARGNRICLSEEEQFEYQFLICVVGAILIVSLAINFAVCAAQCAELIREVVDRVYESMNSRRRRRRTTVNPL